MYKKKRKRVRPDFGLSARRIYYGFERLNLKDTSNKYKNTNYHLNSRVLIAVNISHLIIKTLLLSEQGNDIIANNSV